MNKKPEWLPHETSLSSAGQTRRRQMLTDLQSQVELSAKARGKRNAAMLGSGLILVAACAWLQLQPMSNSAGESPIEHSTSDAANIATAMPTTLEPSVIVGNRQGVNEKYLVRNRDVKRSTTIILVPDDSLQRLLTECGKEQAFVGLVNQQLVIYESSDLQTFRN